MQKGALGRGPPVLPCVAARAAAPPSLQLQQQQTRLMKINHDLRHRVTVVEAQGKALIEQKVELEADLQTKEQEMGSLRAELGKLRERLQGGLSRNGEPEPEVRWEPPRRRGGRAGLRAALRSVFPVTLKETEPRDSKLQPRGHTAGGGRRGPGTPDSQGVLAQGGRLRDGSGPPAVHSSFVHSRHWRLHCDSEQHQSQQPKGRNTHVSIS